MTTAHNSLEAQFLAAGFIILLCSGGEDWAKGRSLSCNRDVTNLARSRNAFSITTYW